MNAATKKPTATADEKKAKAKEIAKKARERRIAAQATMIDVGAEGLAAIEALRDSLKESVGFRPTQEQVVALMLQKASASAAG